jgi:hypothetical protein
MKKKILVLGVIFCVLILGSGFLQAQVAFTLGAHYWRASWEYDEEYDAAPGNLFGPYANVRYGKFSFGASAFFGPFDFAEDESEYDFTITRNDYNFNVGYSLGRGFNVFGALKRISLSTEYSDVYGNSFEQDLSGTMFGGGISLFFPIGMSPFFVTGSAAYLTDPHDEDDPEEVWFYDITAITVCRLAQPHRSDRDGGIQSRLSWGG